MPLSVAKWCADSWAWQWLLTTGHSWPVPFSPLSPATTPPPATKIWEECLFCFQRRTWMFPTVFQTECWQCLFELTNKVFFFIGFFTLHAVLKSSLWTGSTSLTSHLAPLQAAAHVEATFEVHGFRHDNLALIRLAICLEFVSSFVHLLLGFQYLFSVFQKSFVYILPLCVILQGNSAFCSSLFQTVSTGVEFGVRLA